MMQAQQAKGSLLKVPVIVLAVVVVAVLAMAFSQIAEHSKPYSYDYDARDYVYPVENGRYGDLYDVAIGDMDKKSEYSDEVAECRALAFYYEQAVLEHAYREAGDTQKADAFAQRMAEYEAQLGSLEPKAQKVREAVAG